jgi:hypothetical protein
VQSVLIYNLSRSNIRISVFAAAAPRRQKLLFKIALTSIGFQKGMVKSSVDRKQKLLRQYKEWASLFSGKLFVQVCCDETDFHAPRPFNLAPSKRSLQRQLPSPECNEWFGEPSQNVNSIVLTEKTEP